MITADPEFVEAASASSTRYNHFESVKPWLDFVMALVILVLTAPIICAFMLLMRLTSPGPMIFAQRRLGLGGKVFTIYKIRTMYDDSECLCGPVWCRASDPRVTPVGRFLRWCHLDELPQLVNVLMGEMSLVGPRPERPEFLDQLEREIPNYRRRMCVRPGVTGLAQVQQAADTDLSSVRRKLAYDLLYVRELSPWLDFRVLIGTVLKCLGIPFAWIGRSLRLPDPDASPGRNSRPAKPGMTLNSLLTDPHALEAMQLDRVDVLIRQSELVGRPEQAREDYRSRSRLSTSPSMRPYP
jgi:lipopolysaccharide/colanic/teichoic acid biosynthesis glycosyltransferase